MSRIRLHRLPLLIAILAAALLATAGGAAQAAEAAGPIPHVIGEFKNWLLVCADVDSNGQTPEECFLNDAASAPENSTAQVAVAIGLAHAEGGARVMAIQFAFKTGVDRSAPFTVQVDGKPVLQGTVADCNARGCHSAVAPLSPQLLQDMKRGTALTVSFKREGGQTVNASVSLAGFTAASNALSQRAPATSAASRSAPVTVPKATATFRDWSLYCSDTDGNAATPELCRLNQVVLAREPGKSVLAANIAYANVEGSNNKQLVLHLMFPPATDKDAGITLDVDGKQLGSGPVRDCSQEVCHAIVVLSTEVINVIKQGTRMNVAYTLKDKGRVTAPVSLLGITAAIDALVKRS